MNPRRRRGALSGSPLLIGALTVLIAVVAVYISYNANNGLPFAPTYDIKVELPEASGLQTGNEVRLSGRRVGVVSSLEPHEDHATGKVTAVVHLKLEKSVEPLSADTKTLVESVSTIGLKYLELTPGHSQQTIPAGGTIPVSQSSEPVEFQDFFNIFDKPTRIAIQKNTNTFGNAFAERGLGLNETIHELRPLVNNAIPVLHNLASPQTGFGQLFVALDKAASQEAPVAEQQAAFFVDLDTFFTAWAKAAPSLEQTIAGGPAALHQAIYSLPYEAPFIEKTTEFMRLLRPSASAAADHGRAARPRLPGRRRQPARGQRPKQGAGDRAAGLPRVLRKPDRHARPGRIHQDGAARQPAARRSRADADDLQLLRASVPQPQQPPVRERGRRHARARRADLQPVGPQQRGPARLGARQRAIGRTRKHRQRDDARPDRPEQLSCTTTPIPTSPARVSPRSAKRATRPTRSAKR